MTGFFSTTLKDFQLFGSSARSAFARFSCVVLAGVLASAGAAGGALASYRQHHRYATLAVWPE